jgi:DNA repair protein SbcC/Rad50
MKIESVRIKNFLSHSDTDISFDDKPLWLLVGPNGAGKSAIFDAMEFTLFGEHRGGKQNPEHLIKNDRDETEIEVVFCCGDERYRATRKLKRSSGSANVGGSLQIKRGGKWTPAEGVGRGKRSVWNYVERDIISHELFTSAIYLKQGDVDFFLSGSATDRGQRFSRLMNLEEYSILGEVAQERADSENHVAEVRAKDLYDLGDISEEALDRTRNEVATLDRNIEEIDKELSALRQKEADAHLWIDKTSAIERLDRDAENLRELLDEAEEIQTAVQLVQRWETIASDLRSYWESRDRARELREDARQAEAEAAELENQAEKKTQQTQDAQKELEGIQNQLSKTQEAYQKVEQDSRRTQLERDIAIQVEIAQAAKTRLERLDGAEREYQDLENKRHAFPRLMSVVDAREKLNSLRDSLDATTEILATRRKEESSAESEMQNTFVTLHSMQETKDQKEVQIRELEIEIDHLRKEIIRHEQLSGEEMKCPVCDQELNEPAHTHIKETVAVKRARLGKRKAILKEYQAKLDQLQKQLEEAREINEQAKQATDLARCERESLEAQIHTLKARIGDAEDALMSALDNVQAEAPFYAKLAAEADQQQLDALSNEIEVTQRVIGDRYQKYLLANRELDDAQAQLRALRGQRAEDITSWAGDEGNASALSEKVEALSREKRELLGRIENLEEQEQILTAQFNQLSQEITEARTRATERRKRALGNKEAADRAEESTGNMYIPEEWQGCLDTKEAYCERQAEVQGLRSLAGRLDNLNKAAGALEVNRSERERLDTERQSVPTQHRVNPGQVQTGLALAQQERKNLSEQRDNLLTECTKMEERREQARKLQAQEREARSRAKTFGKLARLLKPGGDIQLRVMASVQEEVRQQANKILSQINDSLEIRLGDPRRSGKPMLDVLVFDRRDPASGLRYFEFLSGGERFRVGLAIALAIHWRATKRSPGTVIVDEGFGALDDVRRIAVAEQIADVSSGLLNQGLVEQIIVSTHVAEVYRYFPNRIELSKEDGRAVVKRVEST